MIAIPVVVVTLAACATKLRNVPNHALAMQSTTVVERDRRECERAITGQVKGAWFPAELEFAACMISRNYEVYVQVLDASVDVRRASLRGKIASMRVLTDLMTCEQVVQGRVSVVEMIARPAVTIAGLFFWPASVGSMAAAAKLSVARQRNYTACMQPRGYVVTPWDAKTDPGAEKPHIPESASP
jgi:hypothetical protein